jgi:hypothetical protein
LIIRTLLLVHLLGSQLCLARDLRQVDVAVMAIDGSPLHIFFFWARRYIRGKRFALVGDLKNLSKVFGNYWVCLLELFGFVDAFRLLK